MTLVGWGGTFWGGASELGLGWVGVGGGSRAGFGGVGRAGLVHPQTPNPNPNPTPKPPALRPKLSQATPKPKPNPPQTPAPRSRPKRRAGDLCSRTKWSPGKGLARHPTRESCNRAEYGGADEPPEYGARVKGG
jgi:hypothetical protein